MQITKAEVIPVELKLNHAVQMAGLPGVWQVPAVFIRIETRNKKSAWGCTIAHPELTGENPAEVVSQCRDCATLVTDLHPTNIEFSLARLQTMANPSTAVLCAFDLALHDLLGLTVDQPLYRILGGFRNRIQTSITIPIGPTDESVAMAVKSAERGFRMLKIKGGVDPQEDVRRVQAIRHVLPNHTLRLDADGGYTIKDALDVARVLQDDIEMFEQPTSPHDLPGLRQVKELSPVPVLADQSMRDPASAFDLAAQQVVDGLSIKLAACGGLQNARQVDSIARAARISTMVGCFIEPSLLVAAGLSLALSSPNVHYADLDGHLDLVNDPSRGGFQLEDGWLVASEEPGLGTKVQLN